MKSPISALSSRRQFFQTSGLMGLAAAQTVAAAPAPAAQAGAAADWPARRQQLQQAWLDLLGDFPAEAPPLQPQMKKVDPIDGIPRYHVRFQTEPGEWVTAWLLVPAGDRAKPLPAIICLHGTTWGTGKDRTVGLAGLRPGDPPDDPLASRAYGLELARWGYVTLSIDLFADGERVTNEHALYDSRAFYRKHPEWSMVGKGIWDVQRSVDFLETLDFVDPRRIGCVGHSLGGHYTLWAAAFEPRLAASACNGSVLDWVRHDDHWSRSEGERPEGPAGNYVYIKRFRPYIDDPEKPIPVDFDSLMMLTAPRALLILGNEYEFGSFNVVAKCANALQVYLHWHEQNDLEPVLAERRTHRSHPRTVKAYSEAGTERIYQRIAAADRLSWFCYPGPHDFPPTAKRLSFAWFDRWLDHTPALPTIWPDQVV